MPPSIDWLRRRSPARRALSAHQQIGEDRRRRGDIERLHPPGARNRHAGAALRQYCGIDAGLLIAEHEGKGLVAARAKLFFFKQKTAYEMIGLAERDRGLRQHSAVQAHI